MTGFQRFLYPNMVILFVPLNPAEKSWNNCHYFSSRPSTWKNSLWYQLYSAGFSQQIHSEFEADVRILGDPNNRMGIIDLVDDAISTNPNQLSKDDIISGRSRLAGEIAHYQPKVICFLGKGTYRQFRGVPNNFPVEYGIQEDRVENSKIFLAAFPSSMDKTLSAFKSSMEKTLVAFPLSMENTQQKIEILKDLYQLYKNYLENGA